MRRCLAIIAVLLVLLVLTMSLSTRATAQHGGGEGWVNVYDPGGYKWVDTNTGHTLMYQWDSVAWAWDSPPYGYLQFGTKIRYYFQRFTWPYWATGEEEEDFYTPDWITDLSGDELLMGDEIDLTEFAQDHAPVDWNGSARFYYRLIPYAQLMNFPPYEPILVNLDVEFMPSATTWYHIDVDDLNP
jgi:hypothetical protein